MDTDAAPKQPLVEHLLMLPADQIAYESLSTETLAALALQMTDPFIATSALGELAQRNPQQTKDVATHILERDPWDRYLMAFAITLLYDRDPEGGFLQMARLVVDCKEPKLLESMIENILSDLDRYRSGDAATLAKVVASQVTALPLESFSDPEQRDRFIDIFGGARG